MLTLNRVQDTFEDAIDTGSVRSLTNRKLSPRPSSGATDGGSESADNSADNPTENEKPNGHTVEAKVNGVESKENGIDDESITTAKPIPPSKRNSTASLDNVDLDDGVVEQPIEKPKGSCIIL